MDLPHALNDALEAATADFPLRDLSASVDRLIARYRKPGRADQPILLGPVDVAAYAAYRMPATWGAVRAVLEQLALRLPGYAPASLTDVGGGTGAAAWAAADAFPSLRDVRVLDQVAEALELGRRLAAESPIAALADAQWRRARFQEGGEIPGAELVTVSYVLSELAAAEQTDLVRRVAAAVAGIGPDPESGAGRQAPGTGTAAVVIVEPGTPDGYARILAARDVLLEAGLRIVAPCPHQGECPLTAPDWCHFASRVNRSPLHRRLKDADLGHEDEKFSYVAAVAGEPGAGPSRILRHPQKRKGLVMMQLCTPDEGIQPVLVSKRQGALYRAARDAEWGDAWPPAGDPED